MRITAHVTGCRTLPVIWTQVLATFGCDLQPKHPRRNRLIRFRGKTKNIWYPPCLSNDCFTQRSSPCRSWLCLPRVKSERKRKSKKIRKEGRYMPDKPADAEKQ